MSDLISVILCGLLFILVLCVAYIINILRTSARLVPFSTGSSRESIAPLPTPPAPDAVLTHGTCPSCAFCQKALLRHDHLVCHRYPTAADIHESYWCGEYRAQEAAP